MPRITYRTHQFKPESLRIIQLTDDICRDFQDRGFNLTLRQLFYQLVARGYIPNQAKRYDRLGDVVTDARLAGMLDWDYIEDRTRNLRSLSTWEGPEAIMAAVGSQYREKLWAEQPKRLEVWVEKDALVDVIGQASEPWNVPYFSCRGYTSWSEMWGAAQRFRSYIRDGQGVTIVHLGDHDPSWTDMTRDILERVELVLARDLLKDAGRDIRDFDCAATGKAPEYDWPAAWDEIAFLYAEAADEEGRVLTVDRIVLNLDQVRRYNPPPNFAKLTDARARGYIERYGTDSWELDALDPQVLVSLVQERIVQVIDEEAWEESLARQDERKQLLKAASRCWDQVAAFLRNGAGA